jgi:hypothetical protein
LEILRREKEKRKMYKLIGIFLLSMGIANAQTDSGMDYNGVNPGNDKRQCLSIEECPVWDGDPDTKVFYDLMKGANGTGKVKTDFNWNLHVYLCHQNKLLDSINGEGAFERLAILSAEDGMIPCPIDVDNPHWSYDWESHILKAQSKQVKLLGPKGQQGLMNSTPSVE